MRENVLKHCAYYNYYCMVIVEIVCSLDDKHALGISKIVAYYVVTGSTIALYFILC